MMLLFKAPLTVTHIKLDTLQHVTQLCQVDQTFMDVLLQYYSNEDCFNWSSCILHIQLVCDINFAQHTLNIHFHPYVDSNACEPLSFTMQFTFWSLLVIKCMYSFGWIIFINIQLKAKNRGEIIIIIIIISLQCNSVLLSAAALLTGVQLHIFTLDFYSWDQTGDLLLRSLPGSLLLEGQQHTLYNHTSGF